MQCENERESGGSDDAAAVAQSFQAKRTNASTKRTYQSKINIMKTWLTERYPSTVASDTLVVPLPKEAILGFFGHICRPAHVCDRDNVDSKDMPHPPLSTSCVWGYRSALVDLYHNKLLEIDKLVDTELRRVLDGYEKVINNLKKRGLMNIREGKHQLKASGYEMLALKLMTIVPEKRGQSWATVQFGWSYFVIMWNLMSRSDSVDTIMLQHIEWTDDCLVIEEQGHKGDQTGAEKFGKHVYANPYEPSQCAILSLAVHLFCCPERLVGGKQQLFIGDDNKNRFGRMLRRVISGLTDDEIDILSCKPTDIGTHSLRKGSSSYALGQVNGPTPVSVYLRMGQSLGKLKDRYIHFGEGADQLCGRMIAGLPFNSERFAVLPPHFPPTVTDQMTSEYWNDLVSGFANYSRGIRSAFPFFLASIVYHEQFLRDTLSPGHPIFKARVFSSNELLNLQRASVVLSLGTSPVCGIKATGIPAHLAVAKEVKDLREEVSKLNNELVLLRQDMNTKLPDNVADKVVADLMQKFVVNGVAPVSLQDLANLRVDLAAEIHRAIGTIQVPQGIATQPPREVLTSAWQRWEWGDGKLAHAVPKGWEFPAHTRVKQLWNLWFFGNKDSGIRPYKLLSKQHDIKRSHQMRHSRARKVMEYIVQLTKPPGALPGEVTDISSLQLAAADKVFGVVFHTLLSQLYCNMPKRPEELTYGTIYNRLCKHLQTQQRELVQQQAN
ncbi:hypothetical protein AM587_10002300 [Phytophthora nicotianae]|uniref:Uncharacterized protein n=1 Tax=Phytophthora nicotianae TaxID=4792 RepID=A0A0W8CFX8_PHYNI|nr:hypothetical protein AM587_10002300 [Phytophthora nicotianae]